MFSYSLYVEFYGVFSVENCSFYLLPASSSPKRPGVACHRLILGTAVNGRIRPISIPDWLDKITVQKLFKDCVQINLDEIKTEDERWLLTFAAGTKYQKRMQFVALLNQRHEKFVTGAL